jgi:uncharacterized SAM-binding protein YcdF (DUF218 family)
MFFVLSKVIGFVTIPSNVIALVGALGVILLATRYRRAAVTLLVAAVVGLVVAGLSPLGNVLLLSLSERFPPWQPTGAPPTGIIVLGGAIDPNESQARKTAELNDAAERVVEMLRLARRYPNAKIVFSGGSGNLVLNEVPEAAVAGTLLAEFGISPDRIVLESQSRTTAENAAKVRELITPKPSEKWLLVTSSFHMPRSVGVFRKVGFDVEAYPVDWRTRGWEDATVPFNRVSIGLSNVDTAMHEWRGLIGYWLAGRMSEFFPSPRRP